MKGLLTGSIFLVAISLLAFGCSPTDDGPSSGCLTYDSDGWTYMECPIWEVSPGPPSHDTYTYEPMRRYYARLTACPEFLDDMDKHWTLIESTEELCTYCDKPPSQLAAPEFAKPVRPSLFIND